MSRGEFLRLAKRAGWRSRLTRGGHVRLDHRDAAVPVFTGSTPSDRRWSRNTWAAMKRALRQAAKAPPVGVDIRGLIDAVEDLNRD